MGDERTRLIAPDPADPPAVAIGSTLRPRTRLVLVGLVLGTLYLLGRSVGLTDWLSPESLRSLVLGAGGLGIVLFVVAFSLGLLAHLPGLLFIAAAVLLYGREMGALVAMGGAIVAVSVSFVIVRRFGGRALAEIESPLVKRLLAQLDQRPMRSVILLRAVFGVAPPLNYALALSSLGFRDYLVGSAIGMAVPIGVAALVLDAAF